MPENQRVFCTFLLLTEEDMVSCSRAFQIVIRLGCYVYHFNP